MDQSERTGLLTIQKAAALLRTLGEDARDAGVRELAEELNVPRSTVHRMLVALGREGFVDQDPATGRYHLGHELIVLAGRALRNLDVRSVALPYMHQLSEKWRETVDLDLLRGADILIIEELAGLHLLSTGGNWAKRMPAHCTSTGKVLLAYAGRDYVEQNLPAVLQGFTSGTITSREALLEQLTQVRRVGYARSWGEHSEYMHAIAVPIHDRTGSVCAAMSLSGLAARIDEQTAQAMILDLKAAARDISTKLGYVEEAGPVRGRLDVRGDDPS
jgi:IclR family transcriptional regulator, KDG regulon repressor